MELFECINLNIGYDNKCVCNGISFALPKGSYTCIVGENGSGKSTLIKTILGLENKVSGKISFNKNFNKNKVGYLPQQTELQKDFPAIVDEVVMSGFLNSMNFRPFYNKCEKTKAKQILNTLDIEHLQFKSYRELSGGQQQRVLLARALCATEELIVLDEPTTGMDAKSIETFYKILKQLHEKGLTILMISHNIDKVLEHATHVVLLRNSMEFAGTKEKFVKDGHANIFHKGEKA